MDHLLEYCRHHPYLATATALTALLTIAFELLQRSRHISAISPAAAVHLHNQGALILDVRSAPEFATGHIVNARHIALTELGNHTGTLKKYRDKPIVVCDTQGSQATQAVAQLRAAGFNQVTQLKGGLAAWKQDNLPLIQHTSK